MHTIDLGCRHCGYTISRDIHNGRDVVVCQRCKAVYEIVKKNNMLHVRTLYYDFKRVS